MARPDRKDPHDAEPVHESLVTLHELLVRDTDLLDQIASTRLEIAEALAKARYSLCQECRDNVAGGLPMEIDWSAVALPAGWSPAGLYASYRDRIEQAISETPYRESE